MFRSPAIAFAPLGKKPFYELASITPFTLIVNSEDSIRPNSIWSINMGRL